MKFIVYFIVPVLCLLHCDTSSPTNAGSDRPPCSLVWQDNFDGHLDSRWLPAEGTIANSTSDFSSGMISINNKKLELAIAKKEIQLDSLENLYWGAGLYTHEHYQNGIFKAVMKPNSPPGIVTSFLLRAGDYPIGQWMNSEIIGIEFQGDTNVVAYKVRWFEDDAVQTRTWFVSLDFDASKNYHEYTIEWTSNSIRFFIDDKLSFTMDDAAIIGKLQRPMNIHVNYWVSSESNLGVLDENKLPLQTTWDSIAYYKLVST